MHRKPVPSVSTNNNCSPAALLLLAYLLQLLCNKAENNKVHIRELQHDLQQQQQRTEAAETENRALREKASQWKVRAYMVTMHSAAAAAVAVPAAAFLTTCTSGV